MERREALAHMGHLFWGLPIIGTAAFTSLACDTSVGPEIDTAPPPDPRWKFWGLVSKTNQDADLLTVMRDTEGIAITLDPRTSFNNGVRGSFVTAFNDDKEENGGGWIITVRVSTENQKGFETLVLNESAAFYEVDAGSVWGAMPYNAFIQG